AVGQVGDVDRAAAGGELAGGIEGQRRPGPRGDERAGRVVELPVGVPLVRRSGALLFGEEGGQRAAEAEAVENRGRCALVVAGGIVERERVDRLVDRLVARWQIDVESQVGGRHGRNVAAADLDRLER